MLNFYKVLIFNILLLTSGLMSGQSAWLSGNIESSGQPVPYASIRLVNTEKGTVANDSGFFRLTGLVAGEHRFEIRSAGFETRVLTLRLGEGTNELAIELKPDHLHLNDVVVSASRYAQDRKEAPVVVKVLDQQLVHAVQSLSVSEIMNYQPGVRVENTCQNCGMTQVRLNGLDGAYSQILIDSRPVFSALNSVYGLEQIPSNIVERVEIVRSGGSALYGANAIAGTINIITREPLYNAWQVAGNTALIGGRALDRSGRFNTSLVDDKLQSGATFYGMWRNRDSYDANQDGFSELTRLKNRTIGTQAFLKTGKTGKIQLNLNYIHENRRGGDRLDLPPHLTDITEEITHNTLMAGLSYDFYTTDRKSLVSVYTSGQHTDRSSYYGGLGGGTTAGDSLLALNAYGETEDLALVAGIQWTRYLMDKDVLVVGYEEQHNQVRDLMPGYERIIDQQVSISSMFAQYEWKASPKFKTLAGTRLDLPRVNGNYRLGKIGSEINHYSELVLSPRLTFMYNLTRGTQIRMGYARGFRAPQAFNEDLHIAAVGGEPLFVVLGEDLEKELSDALTLSLNHSFKLNKMEVNVLGEAFYTSLRNNFITTSTGNTLPNGSIVEEVRNGQGAVVQGFNLELSVIPFTGLSLQAGGTLQQSVFREPQVVYQPAPEDEDQAPVLTESFLRNPATYGYLTGMWDIKDSWTLELTGTYTGSMLVPRVINSYGRVEIRNSPAFLDANLRISYDLHLSRKLEIKFSTGVQNFLNSYQNDFDRGPRRDSQYVYGPVRPRTFFLGISFGNIH